jgi:hypothetical protein
VTHAVLERCITQRIACLRERRVRNSVAAVSLEALSVLDSLSSRTTRALDLDLVQSTLPFSLAASLRVYPSVRVM